MYVLIACTAPRVTEFCCHLYQNPRHYSHCHISYDHIMLCCSTFPCRALLGGSFATVKTKIALPFLFQQTERSERNISRQIKSKNHPYTTQNRPDPPNPTYSHSTPFPFHSTSAHNFNDRGVDFKTKFMQVRGKKLKLALWVSRRLPEQIIWGLGFRKPGGSRWVNI